MKADQTEICPEKALLGSLLLSPEHIIPIQQEVRPEDMSSESHRLIYESMLGLVETGAVVDVVTVGSDLQQRGLVDRIGGLPVLMGLTDFAGVTRDHVTTYAKAVVDAAIIRRVGAAGFAVWSNRDAVASAQAYAAESLDIVAAATERSGVQAVRAVDGLDAEIEAVARGEMLKSVDTGIRTENRILYLHPEYTLLGAHGGVGKSMLSLNIMINIALTTPTLYLTLQDTKTQIQQRLLSRLSGVFLNKIRERRCSPGDIERLRVAQVEVAKRQMYIEHRPGVDARDLPLIVSSAIHRHGVGFVVVDYLSKIDVRGTRGSEGLQHKVAGQVLDSISGEQEIPVLAVHHLRKLGAGDSGDRRPTQADFRFGGDNEARNCWALWRPPADEFGEKQAFGQDMELIVVKNNNGPCGKTLLNYDLRQCSITSHYEWHGDCTY